MEFLIRENLTIAAPDLRPVLAESAASQKNPQKRMVIEVAAIHEGVTKNYNKYTAEELEKSTTSWMAPYPKPLILNHDLNSEPIGRMVNSEYKKGLEGEGFIQLRIAVLDSEAAAKVLDGRYLTGSVGGMPTAALCSICHTDVISASREGERCGHERGKIYGEKVCVYEHKDISFHEYSFVNAPGDSKSVVQGQVKESINTDLSIYSVDYANASVERLTSANGFVDVREMMSEVDANKLYLDVAFGSQYAEEQAKIMMFEENVSTIAKESNSSDLEHNQMAEENSQAEVVEKEDEDILDVTDRLSNDLSKESEQETEDEVPVESDVTNEENVEAESEKEEASEDVIEEEIEEEAKAPEEEAEVEPEILETEDKVEDEDKPEAIAEDESEVETEPEVSEEVTDSKTVSTEEEAEVEKTDAEPEAGDSVAELQARVSSLEEENAKLKDQNSKMKAAIHSELAEKVVEAKIAVGYLEVEGRDEAIEEHKARSASSLADALVDIKSFAEKNNFTVNVVNGTVASLEIQAVAVEDDSNSEIANESDEVITEVVEEVDPQDLLVEQFSALLSQGTERYLRNNAPTS